MKTLILGTIAGTLSFASLSFAATSDFERGFASGRESCGAPSTAVICYIAATNHYSATSVTGRTNAEALLKVDVNHLSEAKAESSNLDGKIGCENI